MRVLPNDAAVVGKQKSPRKKKNSNKRLGNPKFASTIFYLLTLRWILKIQASGKSEPVAPENCANVVRTKQFNLCTVSNKSSRDVSYIFASLFQMGGLAL